MGCLQVTTAEYRLIVVDIIVLSAIKNCLLQILSQNEVDTRLDSHCSAETLNSLLQMEWIGSWRQYILFSKLLPS